MRTLKRSEGLLKENIIKTGLGEKNEIYSGQTREKRIHRNNKKKSSKGHKKDKHRVKNSQQHLG